MNVNTLYRSARGDTRTYEGWEKESARMHKELNTDAEFPMPRPVDWWARWTRVLKLVAI